MIPTRRIAAILLAAGSACGALAQIEQPPTPAATTAEPPPPAAQPDAPQPPTAEAPPAPGTLPSLDDLLGTKDDAPPATDPAQPVPGDAPATELDRLLSGEEIGEAFTQAVTLMGDAAERVQGRKDIGLETQRVQEDILRKLDQLLASLDKQQSQSSQSQSKSQPDSQNQPAQRRPSQQGQQAGNDNQGEWEGPPKQEGPLKAPIESARAAWGSLPQRVRDMLMQGSADRFSSRYQRETEAYYKRLAEESKR